MNIHRLSFKQRFQNWTVYWVDLVVALIKIISFGYICPTWDFDLITYYAKAMLKNRMEGDENA